MKEKLKRGLCLSLIIAMALSVTACGQSNSNVKESSSNEASKTGTHVITDHADNKVEVPNDIKRIVVCDILPLPSVLSVFFDSAEKIVGMTEASMSAAKSGILSDMYPEILNASTEFMKENKINIEELTKLNPDVVFYNTMSKELGEQLTKAGFAAVGISTNKWEYNSIETLNQWIDLLTEMFPGNNKADKVREYSKKSYDLVQERVKDIPDDQRARAFFVFAYSDTTLQTSGKKFFGQWWCDAIGAKNVAEELTNDNTTKVSMEQVYKWNPNLIYITNFTSALPEDLYNNRIGSDDWSAIDAVKNKNVVKMPLGLYRSYTPGVDTPITLLWIAKMAYPDKFQDIDITKETVDYYKDVFGVTITEEQAKKIFNTTAEAAKGFV